MNLIIKHFEFKSSEGMGISVDAARFKGKPVFLAVPLARALGYTNPSDALKKHCKSLIKLNYSESRELGFGDNPRGIQLVGQADVFRLIMRSSLPSAERVQDWVCEEVLPALMETGTYSISKDKTSSGLPEYRFAKAEHLKAQALEKNIASARELMVMLPRLDPMAHQTLAASLINPLVGYDAIPLPVIEEHYYTAAEAGQKIGVSANKVGRIANANNLKTDQYGKFFLDKSAHSSKQVEAFRYNANGVEALRHLIHGSEVA